MQRSACLGFRATPASRFDPCPPNSPGPSGAPYRGPSCARSPLRSCPAAHRNRLRSFPRPEHELFLVPNSWPGDRDRTAMKSCLLGARIQSGAYSPAMSVGSVYQRVRVIAFARTFADGPSIRASETRRSGCRCSHSFSRRAPAPRWRADQELHAAQQMHEPSVSLCFEQPVVAILPAKPISLGEKCPELASPPDVDQVDSPSRCVPPMTCFPASRRSCDRRRRRNKHHVDFRHQSGFEKLSQPSMLWSVKSPICCPCFQCVIHDRTIARPMPAAPQAGSLASRRRGVNMNVIQVVAGRRTPA